MSYFGTYNETAWLLAPYLGLRPTQIFPISLESAPFLFSVWFGFVTICYVIVNNSINDHADENMGSQRRKDKTLKNLRTLIFLENARLTKEKPGKDSPPKANDILKLIFDNVVEEPVTKALGISEDNPCYLRAGTFDGYCIL